MSTLVTTKELRAMQSDDLRKEIEAQQIIVVQLRMGLQMGKDKDSARYLREKRQLARMKTILSHSPNKS
ncbi:50S ribosomal protein L29 [Candidatus Peregrinibacteria bacterium]|nr:50S ribosomal protein L29 [Candidatus Peregrinibacteria bacterium]